MFKVFLVALFSIFVAAPFAMSSASSEQSTRGIRELTLEHRAQFCWGYRMTARVVIDVSDYALSEYSCSGQLEESAWEKTPRGWKLLRWGSINDVQTLVACGVPKDIAQRLIGERIARTSI